MTYEQFEQFLRKERVLTRFKKNLQTKRTIIKYYNDKIEHSPLDAYSLINTAFVWAETPEGHYFWSNINNKWLNSVRN